ncbi:sensor histidine kinase [Streptomonospora litoralis]|uniref:histidine kinase n=1 Tax=Streptomonospora litoralis TaxID=2498135 RepID=A0A4V0ZJY2_9ACTN|nr:nitrate- and nitrite sensing domain-containing protein [Streptomonospora litoralis]QBI55072.1 Nitrate and nitrite sensing [Streptomonospora litoralis]
MDEHRPTIRRQLTRIVLIPSISFLVLWAAMAAVETAQAGSLLLSVASGRDGIAAVDRLADDLRAERRLTQIHLGDPDDAETRRALADQRERTDAAARRVAGEPALTWRGEPLPGARAFAPQSDRLAALRAAADRPGADRVRTLTGYSDLIEETSEATAALLRPLEQGAGASGAALARRLITAHEQFARSDALLAGAIAAGGMEYQETAHFTYLTASYRDTLAETSDEMNGATLRRRNALVASEPWTSAERFSRSVVTRPPIDQEGSGPASWNTEIDVGAQEWNRAATAAEPAMARMVAAQIDRTVDSAWTAAVHRLALGAAGSAVTLLAGIAAIVAASRSSRKLTARLRRLRDDALSLADSRLPTIASRARTGRRVDVTAELPRLDYGADELGQVADAFNTAQRTAVGAAVKEAEIRRGANRVFLGIAYRNQALVQRQLRVLDEIEADEEDPGALRRLFDLDHLTTRARRYADNLIILGGAGSARRWREPLPLADVLRGAITETEEFGRVRLTSAPRARLSGAAVADIVHLLAELIENATQFSPHTSAVDVNCGRVNGGIAVEIEDRGLGLTDRGYAEADRVLGEAPDFDVMALPEEPRLGLFVVARLAARHGVAVRLRPSPYGGTSATVVVPDRLVEWAPAAPPGPPPALAEHRSGAGPVPEGDDGRG